MEEKDRPGDELIEIDVSKIKPNPKQSRKVFEKEPLSELGRSIRKRGLLQPINVRPDIEDPGNYIIVHGERRWSLEGRSYNLAICFRLAGCFQQNDSPPLP